MKMGLSVRVVYVRHYVLSSSWHKARSGLLDAWAQAMQEVDVSYTWAPTRVVHGHAASWEPEPEAEARDEAR
jgi:hypothetical protein